MELGLTLLFHYAFTKPYRSELISFNR